MSKTGRNAKIIVRASATLREVSGFRKLSLVRNQPCRQFVASVTVAASILLIAGCSEIDSVNSRAEIMNQGVASYYSEAILLNVVRASKSEPLSFVSLGSVTGHNTVQGNVGLPTITIGPHTPVVPPGQVPARNYLFGPNTVSRTVSNDFNANIVDDSASYAGLLQPINPATIGFFINQGYSRELLFNLFVDRIRLLDLTGATIEEYTNDPVGGDQFNAPIRDGLDSPSFQRANSECFQNYLAWMIREGFTAQVDVDALPSARSAPANRLCADPGLSVWFRKSTESVYCKRILDETGKPGPFRVKPTLGRLLPVCNASTSWTITKVDTGGSTSKSDSATTASTSASGADKGSVTATAVGAGSLTVTVLNKPKEKDNTSATANSSGQSAVTLAVTSPVPTKPPPKTILKDACGLTTTQKATDPHPAYEMCLDGKIKAQIFLRSAFAVYEFLGKQIARRSVIGLYTGLEPDLLLFKVTNDTNYCFVSTSYEGENYCVPTYAENTKRIFSLLRQLVALNTPYANQPATLTVRTTP